MVAEDKVISLEQFRVDNATVKEVDATLQPVMGDRILGQLTPEMIGDFVTVAKLEWQIEEFNDTLKDRIGERSGAAVRESLDTGMAPTEELRNMKVFRDDKEAYEYFRANAEFNYYKAKLVLAIRTLFDNFTHSYEIRAGFVVVQLAKKYI